MGNREEPKEFIWVEALFRRIPLPYLVVSLIIAAVVCLIFEFISSRVPIFNLHKIAYAIPVASISILIAYQLGGIQYLLNDMRKVLRNLCHENDTCAEGLDERFINKNLYHITVISVIAVFFIIDAMRIDCYQLGSTCTYNRSDICGSYLLFTKPCYFSDPLLLFRSWNFFLDIYRFAVNYISYYLIGIILWIIFNVSVILGDLRDGYKNRINVDVYNVDKIGGLRPLFDFILKLSIYYFICITIMITSYFNPITPVPLEIIFLFILLSIGLSFFFWGKTVVQNIFTHGIQIELIEIDREYKKQKKELQSLLSLKWNLKSNEEFIFISGSIELLNKERDRLLQLKTSVIDVYDLILLISSVLTTLVVILQKYQELQSEIREFLPIHLFG